MQFRLFIQISLISILSITGLYAYAATLDIVPVGEVEEDGTKLLKSPMDAAIATINGKTYVIVSAGSFQGLCNSTTSGIEIIDISDPTSPTSVGRVADDDTKLLDGANGNAIATIGGSTYAIIAATCDDGIEIIDITDPTNPTSVGRLGDGGDRLLDSVKEVGIYTRSGSTYAVVTSSNDDGIEIIDISDPTSPTSVGRLGDDGDRELDGAKGIAIETINGTPYAIVGSLNDDGIEIIDISDPTSPTSVGRMDDGTDTGRCTVANGEKCLDQAKGVRTTTINDKTYVIVSGQNDDGIEIIDISDPTNPTSVSRVVDGTDTGRCTVANGEKCLDGVRQIAIAEIGEIGATSGTYYVITAGRDDNGIDVIDISDPENPSYLGNLTDDDSNCSTDGDGGCELDGPSYIAPITSIGTSTYVVVTGQDDNGIQIIRLCENCEIIGTTPSSTASTTASTNTSHCSRHIILGNCGTVAINDDVYSIIHTWTNVPTTEVLVGEPVTVTLSIPNTPTYTKIHFASVFTEIFDSPTRYEQGAHIDYSVMKSDYYVSESKLFQVAAATHRITENPSIKNLDRFEIVFTMIFAKPMDTSHIVVETENKFGIPETLYLTSALKVNENLPQALTLEEKSKFKLEYEPVMEPEPPMEPDVKITCGKGTVLKDNLCVPKEWSFLDFFEQMMKLFG